MRALAVVDSDSYAKWGAAVLGLMPASWDKQLVLVATPVAPSDTQLEAALAGSGFELGDVSRVGLAGLLKLVTDNPADVVLASLRGPVAAVVLLQVSAAAANRPVLVSGLPGISVPATEKAIWYRAQADLFLLHSKRELREFRGLAETLGVDQRFALGTLPFVIDQPKVKGDGRDVIFAAQATVPAERVDRVRLLGWLAELARRHQQYRVVIKVRAERGEQQTHPESVSYQELVSEMVDPPENLVVSSGPMARHLRNAAALVTVSSTAAIEAVARDIPVIAIDDFGVSAELINTVFEGSGLLASSDDLMAARFHPVSAAWLEDNYFHPPTDDDWLARLDEVLDARTRGELPRRMPYRRGPGGALRRAWDRKQAFGRHDRSVLGGMAVVIGVPARAVVRIARRVVRWTSVLGPKHS